MDKPERNEDGSFEYDEAAIDQARESGGLHYEGGKDYAVQGKRPRANLAAQESLLNDTPAEARQRQKRIAAFESLLEGLGNRQEPTGKVIFVTIAEASKLMEEYKQAREEGYQDKDLEVVPLSSYHAKIIPPGRPPIRPLFENEWGVIQAGNLEGTVICIRDKDLGTGVNKGHQVTVPRGTKRVGGVRLGGKLLPGPGDE